MNQNLTVTKTQDNPNGTTTNFLNNGQADVGTYTKNADGSLNFNPLTPLGGSPTVPFFTQNGQNYATSAINSTTLAPQAPLNLPQPAINTGAAALSGSTDSLMNTIGNQITTAQTNATNSKNDLTQAVNDVLGVQSSRGALEQAANIPGLSELSNSTFSALQASKRAQEKELLVAQSSGKTQEGIRLAQDDINRRYAFEQADLAITYDIANRNYTNAQATVDRKIQLALEPLQTKISYLTTFYNDNKDVLNKKEDQQLQLQINQNNRLYEQQKSDLQGVAEIQLEAGKNGAPADVITKIGQAKNKQEALQLAGGYLVNATDQAYKEAQTAKLYADINKMKDDNQILSLKDAQTLGVPYGTTKAQAIALGKVPGAANTPQSLAQAQSNVQEISGIVNDSAIRSAVGPNIFARFIGRGLDSATGARQNFIASVEQMRSQLNLQALIDAKSKGATFGALSDQELQVLASSATKIGSWAIKDKNGNVTGYNASEADFKKELDKINNFAKLDYITRGGDPTDVGAKLMPDGSIWSQNSDGTLTKIK